MAALPWGLGALGFFSSKSKIKEQNEQIAAAMAGVRDSVSQTYVGQQVQEGELISSAAEQATDIRMTVAEEIGRVAAAAGATGFTGGSLERKQKVVKTQGAQDLGKLQENLRRNFQQIEREKLATFQRGQAQIESLASQTVSPMDAFVSSVTTGLQFYELGKGLRKEYSNTRARKGDR